MKIVNDDNPPRPRPVTRRAGEAEAGHSRCQRVDNPEGDQGLVQLACARAIRHARFNLHAREYALFNMYYDVYAQNALVCFSRVTKLIP